MRTPTTYMLHPGAALIGPPFAYGPGDIVSIPGRGPKFGDDGIAPFSARVTRVEADGAAVAIRYEEG